MAGNRTLDEFLGPDADRASESSSTESSTNEPSSTESSTNEPSSTESTTDESSSSESTADESSSTESSTNVSEDEAASVSVRGDDEDSADAGPSDRVASVDRIEPTYRWAPAGDTCAACEQQTVRLWHDESDLVCPDCKSW